ncbi:MAG: sulfite exporter TauE/SafE family protein [Chloroflexota bacterium]|nr:sulfite exporter TauE/SafE family protein [Chloroflexota bacterium]
MDSFVYAGLAAVGFAAGLLGSLLGLGGGIFVVPALTLLFGVPTPVAIGTSNVVVVATSTGAASAYVQNRLANLRLSLVLLVSTVAAALISSLAASFLPDRVLSGLFAALLIYTALNMLRRSKPQVVVPLQNPSAQSNGNGMDLSGSYYDAASARIETYIPRRVGTGVVISAFAGIIAGLLGVGGGIVQVPVMNMLMGVPLKAAAGTSSYMIGVTATSAAFVRYARGDVHSLLVVPTVLAVFFGARLGAWLVPRMPTGRLKMIFGWVALLIAALMLLQALGIYKASGR